MRELGRIKRVIIRCSPQTVRFLSTAAILVWGLTPGRLAPGMSNRFRETLRNDQLSLADYEKMERGYYEEILDAGRKLGTPGNADLEFAGQGAAKAPAPPFEGGPLAQPVDDLREFILKPSLSVDHAGARWTTNTEGMRDQPYSISKPPNTIRIAMVGDSIGAGWGVGDGQPFESLVETALDRESKARGGPAVEILNFAVPGHGPGQRWEHFNRVGWKYEPDLILFESTQADLGWDERRLRGLLPRGIGWDSPMYKDVLDRARPPRRGSLDSYKRVLRPYREQFAAGVMRAAGADCEARGVPVALVIIPRVGKPAEAMEVRHLTEMAQRARFHSILDLSDTYRNLPPASLAVGPNDYHPNAKGHEMLAMRLHAAFSEQLASCWSLALSRSAKPGGDGQ